MTISSRPIVGYIIKWTCQSGKSEIEPINIFVKIRKLDGIITYATADMIKPFKNGAE